MYTFYEYPKCSTCRKAKAELNQLGIEVESINIFKRASRGVGFRAQEIL